MEAYILDTTFKKLEVVDYFTSFIWAERYSAYGDFELIVQSTPETRARFLLLAGTNTCLMMNKSQRIMIIESVEEGEDEEGLAFIKLTGRSMESILDDRVARSALNELDLNTKWELTGTAVEIAYQIFHDICVTGILSTNDILNIAENFIITAPEDVPPPDEEFTISLELMTVYQAIKKVCDLYNIGFSITQSPFSTQLFYTVYTGKDRTTQQSLLPAVVFSEDFENVSSSKQFASYAKYKNTAYVLSPVGHQIVYPGFSGGGDPTGLQRRIMFVEASDITDTTPSVANAKMIQRGREELAKNRSVWLVDGELKPDAFKYGVDYNLGDVVEQRTIDGTGAPMRVSEQIFISDQAGERSYPTLSVITF